MSANPIPRDLERLGDIIEQEFGAALIDEVAPAIARHWKGAIEEVGAVDSHTYLDAVEPGEAFNGGEGLVVIVEAPAARGYSDVIERGRRDGSQVGRYPAKRGVEAAEGDIKSALDRAGDRVRG
jgi:hypothetical protein